MKIEFLALHHLRMPLVAPFETSFGRELERECILMSCSGGFERLRRMRGRPDPRLQL